MACRGGSSGVVGSSSGTPGESLHDHGDCHIGFCPEFALGDLSADGLCGLKYLSRLFDVME